jgi:phosphatidylserine decarboxylase
MDTIYIDRKSRKKCEEKVYGYKALLLFYGDGFFRAFLLKILLPFFTHFPFLSRVYGFLQKLPSSAKKIAPFIEKYEVDATEFVETNFRSFNDFFIRKLKAEMRPVHSDPDVVTLPADGRYLVYPQFDAFMIKGKNFSLKEFLNNNALAHRYREGSMVIARLCPSDYHRFHFVCDGVPTKASLINGFLYSVHPMALRKITSILSENKRMVTEIETERFGTILYVEIGATNVGSMHQTYLHDEPVKKGDEKGYFEFGGSCIVLLFEKNRVVFDEDLVQNTKAGFETRANFGESLGRSKE